MSSVKIFPLKGTSHPVPSLAWPRFNPRSPDYQMTSQPSDHLINNHIAMKMYRLAPVWLPGTNSAEKFPRLLINWHWHWALSISPSISCIYVGIKQTHMPLKMIYSNCSYPAIQPAVIFMKTSRHCRHPLCCAPRRCQLGSPASPWCVFFYEIPSAIINYRSNYREVQGSEMAARTRRRRQHHPVFYDMCQHSAKTDAKTWRSSSKCSDNCLLNCVITRCQQAPCVIIWPQGIPGTHYTLLVFWSLTEAHDYACSCPRYADSDMDTHGASGNWSHVNRANFTAKSSWDHLYTNFSRPGA